MYNRYLNSTPIDVTPQPIEQCEKLAQNNGGLLSALSGAFNGGGFGDLFTEENLIVLGAVAFLTYGENGFDREILALCALFLLLGL